MLPPKRFARRFGGARPVAALAALAATALIPAIWRVRRAALPWYRGSSGRRPLGTVALLPRRVCRHCQDHEAENKAPHGIPHYGR